MFSKTLIVFAAAALTADAVKIKTGLASNALVGVNVRALSKAELNSLLVATKDQFDTYCHDHGKHYLSEEECTARQTNWLESEAYVQSHNSSSNGATFGHNQFSDMSEDEKAKGRGTKKPDHDGLSDSEDDSADSEEEEAALARTMNRYGFKLKMSTEEYQALYDQKYAETTIACDSFDKLFNTKDARYLANQEEKKREKKLAKGWTEDEFESWWMRIMQDRTVAQSSIARCFNDDDFNNEGDDNTDPTPDPEPQPEPTPSECSATLSEFIWGDNVVVPIKNQGQCGSCYAFSAMTVLEGAVAIQYGQQAESLSEQQIVDCQS